MDNPTIEQQLQKLTRALEDMQYQLSSLPDIAKNVEDIYWELRNYIGPALENEE